MPFQAKFRSRLKGLLSVTTAFSGILLAACLAVVVLAWLSLVRSREQYQLRAEITAQNLCTLLADNLANSYKEIDLALLGVKAEYERQLASGGVDGPRLETFMERQRAWIPVLFALRTVNADGIVDHGDLPPGPGVSLADRAYFLRLKTDPDAGLVFSNPLMGRVKPVWSIMLARRLNRPDGSFGGIVYGAIELEKLGASFGLLAIGREGAIALRDPDLALIMRRGGGRDLTGSRVISPEFRTLLEAGRRSGTYSAVTAVDGVARIHSFKRLEPYGQYINVGLGKQDVFGPWRKERQQTLLSVASFLLLIGTSTWVAYRAWRRQLRAEAGRERVICELQKALAEVKALSGMLPICSSCKKIRDDRGYWNQIETYIASRSEAQFTHGICPDCVGLLFPEVAEKRKARLEG